MRSFRIWGVILLALIVAASVRFGLATALVPAPGRLVETSERSATELRSEGTSRSSPSARFPAKNVGGRAVRILATTTSCGCARVHFEPPVVGPGEIGELIAEFDPIEVGVRKVSITVKTDSPVTPVIQYTIDVNGSRRPPYLFRASGDLVFRQGYAPDDSRPFYVELVERRDDVARMPALSCDLPFLRIVAPDRPRELPHASDPALIVRSYACQLKFQGAAPSSGFQGWISVSDPYDSARGERIFVSAEANPPIRAFPGRLILAVGKTEGTSTKARLSIAAREVGPEIRVVPETPDDGLFLIEPIVGEASDPGPWTCQIGLKPDARPTAGIRNLVVSAGGDRLIVPVSIVERGDR